MGEWGQQDPSLWGFTARKECGCPALDWDRCDLLDMLSGLHIAIYGDSLGRHIFQRMIAMLRFGRNSSHVDHYYHRDAAFWTTFTEDCFSIKGLSSCPSMPDARGVRISFKWKWNALRFDTQTLAHAGRLEGCDAIILMSGMWFRPPYTDLVKEIRQQPENRTAIPTFVMTVPHAALN